MDQLKIGDKVKILVVRQGVLVDGEVVDFEKKRVKVRFHVDILKNNSGFASVRYVCTVYFDEDMKGSVPTVGRVSLQL